jgi:serine/threonine-protein kinase
VLSFGPYETLSRIAAGGMGEVFMARRTGAGAFEKKVALKVLLPHLAHDREFVERFFDEARLVARMNHPNIVQIFDVGETDGRPWLAMALVHAVSLSRLQQAAAKKERVPLPLVRLIATGLLEGLAYAHALKGPRGEALGVVHRDISPSNLLVSTDGAVLLTDFGIAKASINMHRTQPGQLRGKLSYLAPEMLTAETVDQRADLFSAAVTLFQLATGVSPFLKSTDGETMDAVIAAHPPQARALRGDLGQGMAAALHRALERQPSARFANAREMREAFCDGPVASAPELGEYVRRLCGAQLEVFAEEPSITPSREVGTSSLPLGGGSITRPSSRRRVRAFSGAFAATLLLLLGGWWAMRSDEPPALQLEPAPPPLVEHEPEREPIVALPAPASGASAETPSVPPGRPARPRPRPASPHPTHPPTVESVSVGFLTADAAPWADVFLDGVEVDRTPLSRYPVRSGSHTLTFKSSDGRKIERPVKIEQGQVQVVRVEFPQQ